MSKNISHIGFDVKRYTSEQYNGDVPEIDSFIKFWYGPGIEKSNWRQIVGKVKEIVPNGLHVITDFGWFYPSYDRISRLLVPKINGRISPKKLRKKEAIYSNAGLLDAAVDRVVTKIQMMSKSIFIEDNRTDLTTRYNRSTIFTYKNKNVRIEIENESSKIAEVSGSTIPNGIKIKISQGKPTNLNSVISRILEMNEKYVAVVESDKPKGKRGRPASNKPVVEVSEKPKGKRGRPRKEGSEPKVYVPTGRKRGRPASNKPVVEVSDKPKGKRGRPKKIK